MASSSNSSNNSSKRVIKGFKKFGKNGAKYSLKALVKIPEVAITSSSQIISSLTKSDSVQAALTTGGLIAASVACTPVAIGALGVVGAKFLGYKITGEKNKSGKNKGILDALKETVLLGNILTKNVCSKIINPSLDVVNNKTKELGNKANSKIDDFFK